MFVTLLAISMVITTQPVPVPLAVAVPPQAKSPQPATQFSSTMFADSEEFIFKQLNLSKEQLQALRANNQAAVKRYDEIRARYHQDGDLWAKVRGYEAVATASKAETRRIMTREQHDKYLALWHQAMAPYIANSQKLQGTKRGLGQPAR